MMVPELCVKVSAVMLKLPPMYMLPLVAVKDVRLRSGCRDVDRAAAAAEAGAAAEARLPLTVRLPPQVAAAVPLVARFRPPRWRSRSSWSRSC